MLILQLQKLNFSHNLTKKAIILLVSTILFYSLTLFLSDFNELSSVINSIKLEYLLLAFPLTLLTILLTGLRFHLVLKKIGINLTLKESIKIFISSLSMLITPGGSGALIKSYILKKKIGVSISSTAPIVIYEKWLEFFSIIIIIGLLLIWTDFWESRLVFLIGLILISFSFFIFKNSTGLKFLNKLFIKLRFTKQFVIDISEFNKTTGELLKPKSIIEFLSISILTKIIPLFTIYLIFISLSSDFDFFSSGQIYFTSTLIGVLTFVPGGVVVTEAGMLGMLLSYGSDFSQASILVLLIRFLSLWFPIILGFIMLKTISKKNFET